MGVILEFRDIWVAFRGVERSRKGTQGPAACTRRVCPLQAGLGLEGRGGGGVCEGPSTPPPLPLRRLVRVNHPGGGALHSWRVVASSSACCRGLRARGHLGSSCPSQTTLGPAAAGGRWAGTRSPTVAWKNFILSLGVRGLHGGGWVFADLAGDIGGPLSQGWGSLSPKTSLSASPPPEMLGYSLPTRGSHGENNGLCPY